jgi:hypothetical protein
MSWSIYRLEVLHRPGFDADQFFLIFMESVILSFCEGGTFLESPVFCGRVIEDFKHFTGG